MNYPELVANFGTKSEANTSGSQGFPQPNSRSPNLPQQNASNESTSITGPLRGVQNPNQWDTVVSNNFFSPAQYRGPELSPKPQVPNQPPPYPVPPQISARFATVQNVPKMQVSEQTNAPLYQNPVDSRMSPNTSMNLPLDPRRNIQMSAQPWIQSTGQPWQAGGTPVNPVQYFQSSQQEQFHPNFPANNPLHLREHTLTERAGAQYHLAKNIPVIPKSTWYYQYLLFNKASNITFNGSPAAFGRPLDLYNLFYAVVLIGGFQRVCAEGSWQQISEKMGLGHIKESLPLLINVYQQYLLAFENYLVKAVESNLASNSAGLFSSEQPQQNSSSYSHLQLQSAFPGSEPIQRPHVMASPSQVRVYKQNVDPNFQPCVFQPNIASNYTMADIPYHNVQNAQKRVNPPIAFSNVQYRQSPPNQIPQDLKSLKVHPVYQVPPQNTAMAYPRQEYAAQFQRQPASVNPALARQYQQFYPALAQSNVTPSKIKQENLSPKNTKTASTPGRKKNSTTQSHSSKYTPTHKSEKLQPLKKTTQKAAPKDTDLTFTPIIYNIDTYGGLDISALLDIPSAPPINMNLFQGPIDVSRIIMSFKSKLDFEIKHALDTLFVVSLNASPEFSLSDFYEIFDLLLLITEGKLSESDDEVGYSSIVPELLYLLDEFDDYDENEFENGCLITASSILFNSPKEKKKLSTNKKHDSNKSLSRKPTRILFQSYKCLLRLEKLVVGSLQDAKSSVYEVLCSEAQKLRVLSAETILCNFSFFPNNQKLFSQSKRLTRLLMSMLITGAIAYKPPKKSEHTNTTHEYTNTTHEHTNTTHEHTNTTREHTNTTHEHTNTTHEHANTTHEHNSTPFENHARNDYIQNDTDLDDGVTKNETPNNIIPSNSITDDKIFNKDTVDNDVSNNGIQNSTTLNDKPDELLNKNFLQDECTNASCDLDLEDVESSLIPDFIIISKNEKLFQGYACNTIERRVNGLIMLSNIAFYYRIKSDFEAKVIWNSIFDFLTTEDLHQSHVALEALTKLILIYENAAYLVKVEKLGLLIKRIMSFLPSEPLLEFHEVQLPAKQSPDNKQMYNVPNQEKNVTYTVFQPTFVTPSTEEMSLWEVASTALFHILHIEDIHISKILPSVPKFTLKLLSLVKIPLSLSMYGISHSNMPTAYSLCIRSLKILLECFNDSVFCKFAVAYEKLFLTILLNLQSIPEYTPNYDNHSPSSSDQHQYSSSTLSNIKYIESLLIECLSMIGHKT